MPTIAELAREYDMQPYELRAFADDMLDSVADDVTEIPAETERTLRDALDGVSGQHD